MHVRRFCFPAFLSVLFAFVMVFAAGDACAQEQAAAPSSPGATPLTEPPPAPDPQVEDILKKIESDSAKNAAGAAAPAAVPQEPAAPQATAPQEVTDKPPAQDGLASAPPMPASAPAPQDAKTEAVDVPVVPALPPNKTADENLFFDSESLVPKGEMRTGAPREVNPALEPGSKLIVVTKDSGAGSMQSGLVSAQRALTLGRYDSALRLYDDLYARNKKDPNVLLGRAIALQKLGNTEQAIRAYQELLDMKPDNTDAQVNMLGLMGQQYPAVALQRLTDLRNKNPENPGILAQMAVVQARLGQNKEALQSLGTAAAIDQNNANHLYNMAVIADRMGDKAKAIEYYQKALETDTIYAGGNSIPREAVYERLGKIR